MAKDGTHQFSKSCDFDGPEVEEIEQLEITGKARTALCGKVRLLNRIMYERTYNIVFYVYRHARPILNVLTLHWIKVPQHATWRGLMDSHWVKIRRTLLVDSSTNVSNSRWSCSLFRFPNKKKVNRWIIFSSSYFSFHFWSTFILPLLLSSLLFLIKFIQLRINNKMFQHFFTQKWNAMSCSIFLSLQMLPFYYYFFQFFCPIKVWKRVPQKMCLQSASVIYCRHSSVAICFPTLFRLFVFFFFLL